MPAWIGHQNRALAASLTANNQVASLPAQNLQNPHGDTANAWQTTPGTTGANVTIDTGSAAATWQLFALARTNLSPAAVVRWRVGSQAALNGIEPLAYDSGDLSGTVQAGYGQSIHLAPQVVAGQMCRVSILNASNADGFLSVALLYAGPAYRAGGLSYQSAWMREATQDVTLTRGGQEFIVPRFARRAWDVAFPSVPGAEVYPEIAEAMQASERGQNVLFLPFDSGPLANVGRDAVFGRMLPQGGVGFTNHTGLRRTWRARFVERL